MKIYIQLLVLLLPFSIASTENPALITSQLSFKITYHNLQLGYVKAVKHASSATHSYMILGRAEGDFLLKKLVSENCIHSTFENDDLIKSVTFIRRNGKTVNATNTTLLQGKYIISTVKEISQLEQDDIHFTVALLYFHEPVGVDQIYSEAWGKLLPLIRINNQYSFTIPDGTTCTFKYRNGALEEVVSDTFIGEIKFIKE